MRPIDDDRAARWPYSSLLIFGTFGAKDVPGRKIALRGTLALIVFVIGIWVLDSDPGSARYLYGVIMVLGSVVGMIAAIATYLSALDELSRRIQLVAFAWTYGACYLLMALALVLFGGSVTVNPLYLLIAEPIRGLVLIVVARSYR